MPAHSIPCVGRCGVPRPLDRFLALPYAAALEELHGAASAYAAAHPQTVAGSGAGAGAGAGAAGGHEDGGDSRADEVQFRFVPLGTALSLVKEVRRSSHTDVPTSAAVPSLTSLQLQILMREAPAQVEEEELSKFMHTVEVCAVVQGNEHAPVTLDLINTHKVIK